MLTNPLPVIQWLSTLVKLPLPFLKYTLQLKKNLPIFLANPQVQQLQAAQPISRMKTGIAIKDDTGLEKEADTNGYKRGRQGFNRDAIITNHIIQQK